MVEVARITQRSQSRPGPNGTTNEDAMQLSRLVVTPSRRKPHCARPDCLRHGTLPLVGPVAQSALIRRATDWKQLSAAREYMH